MVPVRQPAARAVPTGVAMGRRRRTRILPVDLAVVAAVAPKAVSVAAWEDLEEEVAVVASGAAVLFREVLAGSAAGLVAPGWRRRLPPHRSAAAAAVELGLAAVSLATAAQSR